MGESGAGVLTGSLPDLPVACFDGFKPEPENEAAEKMHAWMGQHPEVVGSHRIFGHNIDASGRLDEHRVLTLATYSVRGIVLTVVLEATVVAGASVVVVDAGMVAEPAPSEDPPHAAKPKDRASNRKK